MIRRRVLTAPKIPGGDGTPAASGRTLAAVPRLRLVASLVAIALAVGACGGSGGAEVAAADGDELDFVAPDVRGGQVAGADFAGQDLVIWFWAPW